MKELDLAFTNIDELTLWLKNIHEKHYVELKAAQELPNSFWESYSSFSNTSGGIIILGVKEDNPENIISGVGNPEKTLRSLWDQVSNTNKVNFRNIDNEDVTEYKLDDRTTVIIINIKEAPDGMKPIYLNNKLENTWIRTGEGDRKATKEELAALMRNARPSEDSILLEHFSIDDLDFDSLLSFKERINKRYPKSHYMELSNEDFLVEIGAASVDRVSGKYKLKKGTLLFLGKVNSIKEVYPQYHVDYFNRRGNNPRWIDRITDDEPGEYQMNLYNFYNVVYGKLSILLKESFELDLHQLRIPLSDFDETIRECLVNCLAHADYALGYPSIKIEAFDGWFKFLNPGKMLVSLTQFATGGDSRPRNEIIMKMYRLLGVSERQGFGGSQIFKTAAANDFRRPEIITDLEHTELKIWNVDLVDAYPDFSDDEKTVLRYIVKNGSDKSIRDLAFTLGITEYRTRKAIISLETERNILVKIGNGKATRYMLKMGSVEMLTYLQIALDKLKSQF